MGDTGGPAWSWAEPKAGKCTWLSSMHLTLPELWDTS